MEGLYYCFNLNGDSFLKSPENIFFLQLLVIQLLQSMTSGKSVNK